MIAHLVGSPARGALWPRLDLQGFVALLLGVVALALFHRPGSRALLVATLVCALALFALEAPYGGNHWLLANSVGVLLLAALWSPRPGRRLDGGTDETPYGRFAPGGRGVVLCFYGWTALHKLNRDFLDPEVSCAVFHVDQSLGAVFLPPLSPSGIVAHLAPWAVLVVEIAVVLLLLVPRLRPAGVLLGVAFHLLLSFDLDQHFFDFTAVMLPLLLLFVPTGQLAAWQRASPRPPAMVTWAIGLVLVLASVLPPTFATWWLLRRFSFVVWAPFALWFAFEAVRRVGPLIRRPPAADERMPLLPRSAVAVAVVAGVLLNGLAPYLELKNGSSWNMYSNLRTARGYENHLLLPTLDWFGAYDDPLLVIASEDRWLHTWIGADYALSRDRLLDYLARNPGRAVELRGVESHAVLRGDSGEIGRRLPLWRRKLMPVRALDLRPRARCQTGLGAPY